MIKENILETFEGIADILQIKGEDTGKVKMYRNLAITLSYTLPEEILPPFDRTIIENIRGIGPATIEKIEELANTGKCQYYEDLKASVPAGVLDLMSISGVGPSTAAKLYQELNIDSLESLRQALDDQRLRNLKGMGKKTEEKIRSGLEALLRHKQLRLTGYVLPDVLSLVSSIAPLCSNIAIVGDLRRKTETIRKAQILISCQDRMALQKALADIDLVMEVHSGWSDSGGSAQIAGDVEVEFNIVRQEDFCAAQVFFTGAADHINELNSLAKSYSLDPIDAQNLPAWSIMKSEEDIYKSLGLPFIVPELREGMGEIQAALVGQIPDLIQPGDIRGELHAHSTWSDGHQSMEEMARAALDRGYEYIAFCDHSASSKIANGLDIERILNKMIELREINEKMDIEILMGAEVDILKDGNLDYPDEILEKLDIVIASIHSGFHLDEATVTKRIISAIENRFVNVIGHPTGRLLARRDPYAVNMDAVIDAAAENNRALEINSYPDRLDLKDTHARKAKERGVMMAINTDAHSIADLGFMEYGIYTARRGWVEKRNVLNTLPLVELMRWLHK